MRASILALLVMVGCQGVTEPGLGLDAGPGSPECRRAIRDWVTQPGENAYLPYYYSMRDRVIRKCTPGGGDEPDDDGQIEQEGSTD